MAYSALPTVATSDSWTASQHNTYIKDNFTAVWVGTTAGDTDYYTSATAKARLGIGAEGSVKYSTGSAPAWLAMGTEGMVLTAGASIPEYAYPKILFANVTNSGTQTIPATGSYLNILFNTDTSDANGWHSTMSNTERIIPPVAGTYKAYGFAATNVGGSANLIELLLFKNNTTEIGGNRPYYSNNFDAKVPVLSQPVSLNGTTDYINMKIGHNNAGTLTLNAGVWLVVEKVN